MKSWQKTKTRRPKIVPVAGDDRVAERPPLGHPEVRLAMAHVAVELDERARVAELLGPLAGEQLARSRRSATACSEPAWSACALLLEPRELGLRRLVDAPPVAPRAEPNGPAAARFGGWRRSTARRSGRTTQQGEPREFFYSRYGHPTGAAAEARLGELEGGDGAALRLGDGGRDRRPARARCARDDRRARRGRVLRHLGADSASSSAGASRSSSSTRPAPPPDADIVWVEAPANPVLTVPDWESLARRIPGSSSATRRSRRPSTCARSTRAPTSSSTRRRSS